MRVTPDPLPLPAAGLAGQVSFSFYWAHRFPVEPGWTIPEPRRRPYATLWLIVDGELQVADGPRQRACGPGHLIAWPPDSDRAALNASAEPALLYTMAFDLRLWGELDFFRLYRVPTFHEANPVAQLAQPFAALVDELAAQRDSVTLEAEGWARVLVGRWLAAIGQAGELRAVEGVDERLTTVLATIEADLAGDWSLWRVAELMRLSTVRMRELFVRAVGLPPMRYVALRRIAHAGSLLHDTDLSCGEIAARCGFDDPGYFSRMFHRVAGMPPLVYREQARFARE